MRTILALLLSVVAVHAADTTLFWTQQSSPTNPPSVSYKVESALVGNPTNATWTLYGTTTTTNLFITNNVYLMFRVRGVSAAGVASDPSNIVTNYLAQPAPPGGVGIISASIESAPTPDGPWNVETSVPLNIVMQDNRFYRSRVEIGKVYQ